MFQNGFALGLTESMSLVGPGVFRLALDGVKPVDVAQRYIGFAGTRGLFAGRVAGLLCLDELASGMRPTAQVAHTLAGTHRQVTAVIVGLQVAPEALQQGFGHRPGPTGRIVVEHRSGGDHRPHAPTCRSGGPAVYPVLSRPAPAFHRTG